MQHAPCYTDNPICLHHYYFLCKINSKGRRESSVVRLHGSGEHIASIFRVEDTESREEPGVRIKLSSACCMTVVFTVITVGTSAPTMLIF
jgi:hypothetical protein